MLKYNTFFGKCMFFIVSNKFFSKISLYWFIISSILYELTLNVVTLIIESSYLRVCIVLAGILLLESNTKKCLLLLINFCLIQPYNMFLIRNRLVFIFPRKQANVI